MRLVQEHQGEYSSLTAAAEAVVRRERPGLYKTECVRTTVFRDGAYRSVHDVEYADRWLGRLVKPAPAAQ